MFRLQRSSLCSTRALTPNLSRSLSSSARHQRLVRPTSRSLLLSNHHISALLPLPNIRSYSAASSPSPSPAPSGDLSHLDEAEQRIHSLLSEKLAPSALEVRDVSGGCGSMYAISVTSGKFKGLSVMKQHRMVNEALKGEMEKWHGCQIRTKSG
ncbi:hypothetical protein CAC42_8138 [Sphaceloma murrayae]|uniref:Bola-like protein n=1 Tax=Sphaceloma murrayae TaxID=2082308 RepID=A0A2K1QJ22_9PEZI|nr:hypothetical protein CAC42_8138 [Sphaceloma murrayae]